MSRFVDMAISSGSSIVLGEFSGYGFPRLFEGSTALYIYRMSRSLLRSDDFGSTWSEIGNSETPRAICQDDTRTIIFTVDGLADNNSYYQTTPESSGGWTTTGSLASAFQASDAVTNYGNTIGVLAGNIHSGLESRIVKSPRTLPYAFADSDSGIPQSSGSIALINDLEVSQ